MSKFDQFETFALVVEQNSFAGAARKLNISPAAVSKQIQLLEKRLGAQLLNRTTRQIALTDIGRVFYEHCQRIFSELREAESSVSYLKGEPSGSLNIMTNIHFCDRYITPHLDEFMSKYPAVDINLELADRIPDLSKEKIDAVFGIAGGEQTDLSQRKLLETRLILVASPEYLQEHGTPSTPMDLTKHQYITHNRRNNNHTICLKDGKEVYLTPHLVLYHSAAMLKSVKQGLGIALIPEYAVADELADGSLVEVLSEHMPGSLNLFVYYQKSQYIQPKIRQFIEFVIANIENKAVLTAA